MEMDFRAVVPPSGAPLSLWVWVAQLLITTVFATGFITYYQQAWHMAFETYRDRPVISGSIRCGMLVGAIVVGIALHMVGWLVFANASGLMFHNLGLFALTFPLMVEGESIMEYLVQVVGVVYVWNMHHMGYFNSPQYVVSMVVLAVMVYVMWRYKGAIRYHVERNVAVFAVIGISFWALLPHHSAGLTMNPLIAVQGFTMYLGMVIATAYFLRADHRAGVRNQENDQTAHFDSLTNAKSYATYKEDVTAAFAQAKAQGQPLSMAAVDIDYFKQINDHYGHLCGDDVLVGIARQLSAVLARHGGRAALYRTGGEEFNVLLPGMDAQTARPIVEDCWRSVRQSHFASGANVVQVTISAGVVDMVATDNNIEDLYRRADESLYQSKHRGRDTITVNGQTVTSATEHRPVAIRTILTQRVYDTRTNPLVPTHDEVILATYEEAYDRWDFPEHVHLPLSAQLDYISTVLAECGSRRFIMNLTPHQFLDPGTPDYLARFKASQPQLDVLVVELDDLPEADQIIRVAPRYRHFDLRIELDNLDPIKDAEVIRALLPTVDGLKFDVNRVRRAAESGQKLVGKADFRQAVARYNVSVVVNGIENSQDAAYAQEVLDARYVQGYYYDRPELPRFA